jgi:hypothetical protein
MLGDPPLDVPFRSGELDPEPLAAGGLAELSEILVLFREAGRFVGCCCHCEMIELFKLLPGSGRSMVVTMSYYEVGEAFW